MKTSLRAADSLSHRAFAPTDEDLAYALLHSDLVAFALLDSGNIVTASPALREMLGATTPDQRLDGRDFLSLVAQVDVPAASEFCSETLRTQLRADHHCHLLRVDGAPLSVLLSAAPVTLEAAPQLLVVVTDASVRPSETSQDEQQTVMVGFDRATGFATRALLLDRMKIALAAARRYRRRAALLRIDLDRLRPLLQSLSAEAADEVQATAAEALRNCVRDCDTTARLGVAEFAVLLPEIGQREDAGITAARVVQAIEALFARNEMRFRVSAHIGVAVYPTDGTNPQRLLSGAETALRKTDGTSDGGFALADGTSAELTAIKPLEFLQKYCVGVPEIDAEHRDLVARLNALTEDLRSGVDPKTLEYDVRAMIELLRTHFATESSLLSYASAEGNFEARAQNLRFLEELHCILLHANPQSIALAVRHLYDWMIPHLLHPAARTVS